MTIAGTTLSFGPATRAAEPPFEPATHAHSLARKPAAGGFNRIPVCSIEDLSDGVLGAGLEVAQLSNAPAVGSLAFLAEDGILCSTGRLTARVALSGPLSQTMITLGVGLRMPSGTRQWLNRVSSGVVGIFLSGDEHDAYYVPGTLYATVTLPAERLEQVAERVGLVLDARTLGGTGIVDRALETGMLVSLQARFERLHDGRDSGSPQLGRDLLDAFILHLGRDPRPLIGGLDPCGYGRIVARARDYVLRNLENPISIDDIADAAFTSRRTLHRAFCHVLDETPQSYVRKLRLNRVRQHLATSAEAACTVTIAANQLGISELGRLSGWYRELFGELPSDTLRGIHPRLARSA